MTITIVTQMAGGAYTDFTFGDIPGIFRVVVRSSESPPDLSEFAERHIVPNRIFLLELAKAGGYGGIASSATSLANWGGGWEWEERRHPLLDPRYRLDWCVAWHTCPWGDRNPDLDIRSMDALYRERIVRNGGVTIAESVDRNRKPVDRFTFFPFIR